jgi:hypothetical protein
MTKIEIGGIGCTAGMEETRNACNILVENMQRINYSGKVLQEDNIKITSDKYVMKMLKLWAPQLTNLVISCKVKAGHVAL